MKKPQLTLSLAAVLLSASALASGATLVGTSVTGALAFPALSAANQFDPVYGFVPAGYLNAAGTTVTVSATAVEFGYDDLSNRDTADFTDTQLLVSDGVEASGSNFSFTMTFRDAAFTGAILTEKSDTFPLTYSLAGDVLTLQSSGGNFTAGQTFAASFNIAMAAAAVPEPASFPAIALLGLAAWALRKHLGHCRKNPAA